MANSNVIKHSAEWLSTRSTLADANLDGRDCEKLTLESGGAGLDSAVDEWAVDTGASLSL